MKKGKKEGKRARKRTKEQEGGGEVKERKRE